MELFGIYGNYNGICNHMESDELPPQKGVLSGLMRSRLSKILEGHTYQMILEMLSTQFNEYISEKTLRRVLKGYGLDTRQNATLPDVEFAVRNEEIESNGTLGYRMMSARLRMKYKIIASLKTISAIQKDIAPENVEMRKLQKLIRREYVSLGPDYTWHFDGWDKLQRFGFAVHGCVDGFSRKLIWLHVAPSNRIARLTLSFYMNAITLYGYAPNRTRSDCGSEVSLIAATQMTITGNDSSHIYGPSTANTRIESLWRHLRGLGMEYWRDKFLDFERRGIYNCENEYHRICSVYVFAPFIQQDLSTIMHTWNSHKLRSKVKYGYPFIPNFVYNNPHHFRGTHQRIQIPENIMETVDKTFWAHIFGRSF
jgi:hypothetical protein